MKFKCPKCGQIGTCGMCCTDKPIAIDAEAAMMVLRQSITDLKIAFGDMNKSVEIAVESISRIKLEIEHEDG